MGRPKKNPAICKVCKRGQEVKPTTKDFGTQTELHYQELETIISHFFATTDKSCFTNNDSMKEDRAHEIPVDNEEPEADIPDVITDDQTVCVADHIEDLDRDLSREYKNESPMDHANIDVPADDATNIDVSLLEELKLRAVPKGDESPTDVRKSRRLAIKYPKGKRFASPTKEQTKVEQEDDIPNDKTPTKTRSCLFCSSRFNTLKELREHNVEEHDDLTFKCEHCPKSFPTPARLQVHMRTHTSEKSFTCNECCETFGTKSKLLKHVRENHGSEYQCEKCLFHFQSADDLSAHTNMPCSIQSSENNLDANSAEATKPQEKRLSKCAVCDKMVVNLKCHKLTHQTERPHVCLKCSATFKTMHELKKHALRHVNTPMLCSFCGKCFNNLYSYRSHIKNHEDPTVYNIFPCTVCNIGLPTAEKLEEHQLCHTNNTPFTCLLCPTEFETPEELKKHVPSHPAAKIPVNCNYCDKLYSTLSKMQIHRHIHISHHQCSYCDKSYNKSSELKRHIAMHTGVFRYSCEECGKGFVRRDQLKKHAIFHTGIRDYKCDVCDGSYISEDALKTHKKNVHGPKIFVCNICGKAFPIEIRLKFHLARHLGQKDYKCNVCGKGFADPADLPQHKRMHMKSKNYKCNLCPKAFYQQKHLDTHRRVTHKNRTTNVIHMCQICGKVFPREWKLRRHELVHRNKSNRIDFVFRPPMETVKLETDESDVAEVVETTSLLQTVVDVENLPTVTATCSLCGSLCETNHLADPFVCGMCSQVSIDEGDKMSVFTFTGQEVFKCNMCQKQFLLLNDFLTHMQEHPELEIKIETLPVE